MLVMQGNNYDVRDRSSVLLRRSYSTSELSSALSSTPRDNTQRGRNQAQLLPAAAKSCRVDGYTRNNRRILGAVPFNE